MKILSKTVVRHYGKSDKWPRYRIAREFYWIDENGKGDVEMELIDEIFWTGNDWSDKENKAILYTNLATAIEDKDKIEETL